VCVTHSFQHVQAWDTEDVRLARWTYMKKQVNPNVAMHLVAEIPPIVSTQRIVACDGGGGALGHPKIYLCLVSVFIFYCYPFFFSF
jgi:NADH dehydrogenase (ubiquinone) Fe-S protein 6